MFDKLESTGQPKIIGYRELTEEEVQIINDIKTFANQVGELVDMIHDMRQENPDFYFYIDENWYHDGVMTLKKGFMFLTRAIAKPTTF